MNSNYVKIIEKAYESFATNGYEKTSLNSLASEIGISKPAIYYYFKSKEELFETIYRTIIDEIEKEVIGLQKEFINLSEEKFIQKVINIGISDIGYLRKDPHLGVVLKQYYLLSLRNENLRKLTDRLSSINYNKYLSITKRAIELSLICEDEIEQYTTLLHMIDSSISEQIIVKPDYDYESLWTTFVNKIFMFNDK